MIYIVNQTSPLTILEDRTGWPHTKERVLDSFKSKFVWNDLYFPQKIWVLSNVPFPYTLGEKSKYPSVSFKASKNQKECVCFYEEVKRRKDLVLSSQRFDALQIGCFPSLRFNFPSIPLAGDCETQTHEDRHSRTPQEIAHCDALKSIGLNVQNEGGGSHSI